MIERHRTQPGTRPRTPEEAWRVLAAGNARFMADERAHPHQDVHFRHRIAAKQNPFAIFFGCADSRVAAEIIFDQGLGDLFVVRTAGHVVDPSVLGSLEFGVGVLDCPLIVVLGHDSCGAVSAAEVAVRTGEVPGGFLRDIVERVTPERPRRVTRWPHAHDRADRARARRAHLRPDQRALHAHRRPHPLRRPGCRGRRVRPGRRGGQGGPHHRRRRCRRVARATW